MGETNRKLSAKEEAYCQGILSGLDGAAAWRKGYGKGPVVYARIQAHKVSKRPHVIARLAELRRPDDQRKFLTIARKREILEQMAESKKTSEIGRQRAIDIDNRMTGVYTSKIELTGEITIGSVLDALATAPALPDAGEVLELGAGDVKILPSGALDKSPAEAGQGQSPTLGPFEDDAGADIPPLAKKGLKTGLVKVRKRTYAD